MKTPILCVENLAFEYPGKRVLEEVSFTLSRGSITALVGPNGAGKTTLMRCIAALDTPFSGTITLGGIDALESPRLVHSKLGYVSDFFGIYELLTVEQCLLYIAELRDIAPNKRAGAISSTAKRLGLTPYLGKAAGTLSRGWRQRLGIAQALLHEPELLILDEPASGLDPEARLSLSQLFLQLKEEGMTILVSSHILAELEDYCNNMLLIRDGRLYGHSSESEQDPSTQKRQLVVRLRDTSETSKNCVEENASLSNIRWEGATVHATIEGDDKALEACIKHLVEAGVPLCEFRVQERRLQDVYMEYASHEETANAAE